MSQIAARLQPLGFEPHESSFYRTEGDLVKVISVYHSSVYRKDWGSFSINVGVFCPKAYAIATGNISPRWPAETESTVRLKVRVLSNFPKMKWEYDKNSDVPALAEKMADYIVARGIPKLNSLKTYEDVLHHLAFWRNNNASSSRLTRAALLFLMGKQDESKKELLKYIKEPARFALSSQQRDRTVWELAKSLGYDISDQLTHISHDESCFEIAIPYTGESPSGEADKAIAQIGGYLWDLAHEKKLGYTGPYYGVRARAGVHTYMFWTDKPGEVNKLLHNRVARLPATVKAQLVKRDAKA